MFDELDIFINNVINISANLSLYVAKAGEKSKEELADLNVEQMNEGLLSTGKKITPKYSKAYAKFKGFSTPNLKLEGDFQSGVYVERKGNRLLYDSKDEKSNKLEEKYTSDIFSIAQKNEQKAADEMDDDLLNSIDKDLLKNI